MLSFRRVPERHRGPVEPPLAAHGARTVVPDSHRSLVGNPRRGMSTVRRRAALALALLLAVLLLPRGAGPVQAGDPDVNGAIAQQQDMQAELSRQQQQLASLLADHQNLGASLQQLRGDLDAVGVAIGDAEAQLQSLSNAVQRSKAELAADRAQLANLSRDLAQ